MTYISLKNSLRHPHLFLLYFSSDCGLSEEDAKTIRVSLLNLIKFYIVKEITLEELNQLIHFMIACKDENMVTL